MAEHKASERIRLRVDEEKREVLGRCFVNTSRAFRPLFIGL